MRYFDSADDTLLYLWSLLSKKYNFTKMESQDKLVNHCSSFDSFELILGLTECHGADFSLHLQVPEEDIVSVTGMLQHHRKEPAAS